MNLQFYYNILHTYVLLEILTKMLRNGSAKPLTDVVIGLHQNMTERFDTKA